MINWIKENKWKILIVIIAYLLICVSLLGGIMTSYHFVDESLNFFERLEVATESWATYAMDPFKVIETLFDGGDLQQKYLMLCAAVLIIFIAMAIKLIFQPHTFARAQFSAQHEPQRQSQKSGIVHRPHCRHYPVGNIYCHGHKTNNEF